MADPKPCNDYLEKTIYLCKLDHSPKIEVRNQSTEGGKYYFLNRSAIELNKLSLKFFFLAVSLTGQRRHWTESVRIVVVKSFILLLHY